MLAVTHTICGAAGWLAVAPAVAPGMTSTQVGVSTVVAAGAALAPDIDHPGSTVSRSLGPASRLASAGVSAAAGGHRMLTHSFAFVALVAAVAWGTMALWGPTAAALWAAIPVALATPLLARRLPIFISTGTGLLLAALLWYAIHDGLLAYDGWLLPAVTIGVLLHTVPGDLLTPSGVPLLAPFTRRRFAIPLFRTGSPVEALVGTGLTVTTVWLLVRALG